MFYITDFIIIFSPFFWIAKEWWSQENDLRGVSYAQFPLRIPCSFRSGALHSALRMTVQILITETEYLCPFRHELFIALIVFAEGGSKGGLSFAHPPFFASFLALVKTYYAIEVFCRQNTINCFICLASQIKMFSFWFATDLDTCTKSERKNIHRDF